MKKLTLLVGAVALAGTAPAVAKPDKGHGNGKHAVMKNGKAHKAGHSNRGGLVTSDRYGRMYALDARGSCPPGLSKKNNGCLPPGHAKKSYDVGQRYNRNFGNTWTYNQIPDSLRSQYNLEQSYRYYYNDGYLYQVDPKTMLVQQVISALLR
jgi:hypothetical protein